MATDYNQMVKWALSFALSGELSQQTLAMSGNEIHSVQLHHKEEAEGRLKGGPNSWGFSA